ncbi:hypothetical protein HZS38_16100 [Xenorhabdus nematophila]|uniref:Uncharacterized protein n=1 Tax=Xenorhabdus nematophila (strain ATCC 19061 / DSM 3370 / CCUG 14189 / LMG 1036 / NCIMB 9965 / AN6) TaxID=406817 RepID=D3VF88_XENNA|nr:hypothetical protein [Xenorhabdus nematophila]CEE91005.1 hypothetical protein; putative exported protein [Xenorhabdus nematophila str. Anatoliense]CEF29174.1 hypothetical protein; putative exported protein [Xenorhabdus nematophila str. Websteri]AYA41855.1 hypothetical protein D3790_16615 [Xenorhabdus nematophila]KHD29692.1 hypothetical protein LH67_01595 [Xenorhabdus nematophila]MBA0020587.1 hypothetical protein [Xenorhabdus nematophila]
MSSYISKLIVLFTIIYALLTPSTMMTAFAEGNLTTNKISAQQTDKKDNLIEQAKSYALGHLNSQGESMKGLFLIK